MLTTRRSLVTAMPEQGQRLPEVEFIAESGERLAAGDLAGSKTVLYFYPKDDTPGCTREACAFRDRIPITKRRT